MKYRNGFVSNSSSASFIVNKRKLEPKELFIVKNYDRLPEGAYESSSKEWIMTETNKYFTFSTDMDNYELDEVFRLYGIPIDNYYHS